MKNQNKIKLFEDKKIRTLWNEGEEQWYFSIIDIIAILTEQDNYQGARNYWKVLKHRLIKEGNETVFKNFPLNVVYFAVRKNGDFEMIG